MSLKGISFDSKSCESKFRLALGNLPSKARIEKQAGKTVLYLRPDSILAFGHSLIRSGMQNCKTSNRILRRLDREPEEFIRFEH